MSTSLITAKREELETAAYEWAKEQGLALSRDQVVLTLHIKPLPDTTELSEEDWAAIFSRHWNSKEFALLELLRDNGNEQVSVTRVGHPKDGCMEINHTVMAVKFGSANLPYYLSVINGSKAQMKKRRSQKKAGSSSPLA